MLSVSRPKSKATILINSYFFKKFIRKTKNLLFDEYLTHIFGALSFYKNSFVRIFPSIGLNGEKKLSFLRFIFEA